MNLQFGKHQLLTSERLQQNPAMGKILSALFGYSLIGNYSRAIVFKKLLKKIPVESFKKILDLGCGFGEYSIMLAEGLPQTQITALDINQKALKAVRNAQEKLQLKNLTIFEGYTNDLPDQEKNFDLIFAVDVFEHILKDEMPFQECKARLAKGGFLLIKIPNIDVNTILPESFFKEHNEWLKKEHIGQVYDLDGLRARFEEEGFEIVSASYADGFFSRLGWETAEFAKKGGMIPRLLFLPVSKLFIKIDNLKTDRKRGNTIQVIGKKP